MADPTLDTWRFVDFVLVMAGGVVAGLLVGIATAGWPDAFLPATVLAQYAGHLLTARAVLRWRVLTMAAAGLDIAPSDTAYLAIGIGSQFVLALLFLPLSGLLDLDEGAQAISEQLVTVTGWPARTALLLGLCLLGPLAEELMFRGFLMRWLAGLGTGRFALVASSAVFAGFHILGVSTSRPWQAALVVVPQTFLFGLILGRLAQRFGRLGPSVFTHAGFNLVGAVVLMASAGT